MSESLWAATITADSGLLIAAITYGLTKQREREADWRKPILEIYRDFTFGISNIAGPDATDENKVRFNLASSALHLIGSQGGTLAQLYSPIRNE